MAICSIAIFSVLVLFSILAGTWCRVLSPHTSLSGEIKTCSNEGERVFVDLVAENPCFQCFCRNGRVECDHTSCPSLKGCHAILFVRPRGSCCDQCKGCVVNGTILSHGEVWKDFADPCKVRMCQAGVLTTSRDICKPPCSNPVYTPGQCCPSCSGCSFEGNIYKDGERFYSRYDQDVECSCRGGNISCGKRVCPVLNCPQEYLYRVKGERCPQCKGQRRVYTLRQSCYFARQVYAHGDVTMLDTCTSCVCQKGTMSCERKLCPELRCPPSERVFTPGECCPKCKERPICKSGDRVYEHGEQWKEEHCTDCLCDNGRKWCRPRSCPKSENCPVGFKKVLKTGACCETCVREEKVCSVAGKYFDSYKTFDGLRYNMTGSCSYTLVKDCVENQIKIRIRYKKRRDGRGIINYVLIDFGKDRIKLYRKLKIRVNRSRLMFKKLIKPATFYVRVKPPNVIAHDRKSGIRVVWDMFSSLKVKIDNRFRKSGRLCGLCGNYNGRKGDDFVNQIGKKLSTPKQMSAAWSHKKTCIVSEDSKSGLEINDSVDTLSHFDGAVLNRSSDIDNRLQPDHIDKDNIKKKGENKIYSSEKMNRDLDTTYKINEMPRHHFVDTEDNLMLRNIKHRNAKKNSHLIKKHHESYTSGKKEFPGKHQEKRVEIISILSSPRENKDIKISKPQSTKQFDKSNDQMLHLPGDHSTEFGGSMGSTKSVKDVKESITKNSIANNDTKTEARNRLEMMPTKNNSIILSENPFASNDTKDRFNLRQNISITREEDVNAEIPRNGSTASEISIANVDLQGSVNKTQESDPKFLYESRTNQSNEKSISSFRNRDKNDSNSTETSFESHSVKNQSETSNPLYDSQAAVNYSGETTPPSHSTQKDDTKSDCDNQKSSQWLDIRNLCIGVRNWILSTCAGSLDVEKMMTTCIEKICSCKEDIQCSQNVFSDFTSVCVMIPDNHIEKLHKNSSALGEHSGSGNSPSNPP